MSRACGLCVALSLLLACAATEAHSTFQRSEPKDGALLASSPNEIRIWFSEPIKLGLSTITVRNAAGEQVDRRDLRADAKEPTMVHVSLGEKLAPGTYEVSWTAVAQDMHAGKGVFHFRIAPGSR